MLTSFAITSCERKKAVENRIKRVDIATGGCFGPCQLTALSLDSSLQYKYYGGETPFFPPDKKSGNLKGYFTGTVSQQLWDSVGIKLNQIHYQQLDTAYTHSLDDERLELFIQYGNGKTKHISAQSASLPDTVREVFFWIANTYKKVNLKPIKDSIKFRTTIQWSPLEPPPLPKAY